MSNVPTAGPLQSRESRCPDRRCPRNLLWTARKLRNRDRRDEYGVCFATGLLGRLATSGTFLTCEPNVLPIVVGRALRVD
jgi:hypothetical protein